MYRGQEVSHGECGEEVAPLLVSSRRGASDHLDRNGPLNPFLTEKLRHGLEAVYERVSCGLNAAGK
jgi:hypothetical protein